MLGLYIHIPFCEKICHYCDFAKTANYDQSGIDSYFKIIENQLVFTLNKILPKSNHTKINSIFIGGGTPSLFTDKFDSLFRLLDQHISIDCEITLETNPNHVTKANLFYWKKLGINRISLGIQSFQKVGLNKLTRTHSPDSAKNSIELAKSIFDNISIDLIYGWPHQNLDNWKKDLELALEHEVDHLSLYCLTYEGNTVFNRRKKRNLVSELPDRKLEDFYSFSRNLLKSNHFDHYEVSNWAKENKQSKHNQIYWTMNSYMALGIGSHGFIQDNSSIGIRYFFDKNFNRFYSHKIPKTSFSPNRVENLLNSLGAKIEKRDPSIYIYEMIASSLRTKKGLNLQKIRDIFDASFKESDNIKTGKLRGNISINEGYITLTPKEWFRENLWGSEILKSLTWP